VKPNALSSSQSSVVAPVMDAAAIDRALRRIAHEIIERNPELSSVILAGIPSRGVAVARRLADIIESLGKTRVATGAIDVSMHRDDVGTRAELPRVQASTLPLPLEGKTVIIVDGLSALRWTRSARSDGPQEFSSLR